VRNYSFFAACGAVTLASTMTVNAQTPAQPPTTQPQAPTTQPATRADQNSVTVTGCLKPDTAMGGMGKPGASTAKPGDSTARSGSSTSQAGTTGMAGTRYVLSNVQSDKGTATSGSAAGTQSAAGTEYIVMAGAGVNLAAHVNHQVRVVGTVDGGMSHGSTGQADRQAGTSTARPGEVTPSPSASRGHAGSSDKKTLTATSVTMISATCTTTSQ